MVTITISKNKHYNESRFSPPRLFRFKINEYQKPINIGKYKHSRYGQEREYNVLVMDLLGPSLEDLFTFCSRRFTIKTVLMLADQMIGRIEFVHCKHFIHRDIKPDNFLMGIGRHCNKVTPNHSCRYFFYSTNNVFSSS